MSAAGYVLSDQQRAAWRMPGGPARGRVLVMLSRRPEPAELAGAVGAVVGAHEVLTTTFRPRAGARYPLQVPGSAPDPAVTVLDTSAEHAVLAAASAASLDPVHGPVVSVATGGAPDGPAVLVVEALTLVADGYTLRRTAEEIVATLDGSGTAAPGVRYVAYAASERELPGAGARDLDQLLTVALPYERAQRSAGVRSVPLAAHPDADLALAAWALVLARMTRSTRVAVALLVDGRAESAELADARGPYERMVPVVLEPTGRVDEYRDHVARSAAAARASGVAPGSVAGAPTVRAGFVVAGADTAQAVLPARPSAWLDVGPSGTTLHTDPAAVPATIADGLTQQLEQVIRALDAAPEGLIANLVVPGAHPAADELVPPRPAPARPAPVGPPAVEGVRRVAAADPGRPLLADPVGELSAADLAARVDAWSDALTAAGVRPGSLVVLALPRGTTALAAALGVLAAQGVLAPAGVDQLAARVEALEPAVVITDAPPETGRTTVAPGPDGLPAPGYPVRSAPARVLDGGCYVLGTSGSTGEPKSTAVSVANVRAYSAALGELWALGPADRLLHTASLTFSSAMRQLLVPLEAGAAVRVASPDEVADPVRLLETVVRDGITVLDLVPSLWRRVVLAVEADPGDLGVRLRDSDLRLLTSASEPMPSDLARRITALAPPTARVMVMYGLTETTGIVAARTVDEVGLAEDLVDLGEPLPGIGLALLDGEQTVPPGVVGEIVVAGDTVAPGYVSPGRDGLEDPAVTIPDAAGCPVRVLRTGDLARRRPDGRLDLVGRTDRQVKIRGVRVAIAEVETALLGHPAVVEAAVVVEHDSAGDASLHAFLIPQRDQRPTQVDVTSYLVEQVPEPWIPARYTVLGEFPRLASGKVDHTRLDAGAESADRVGPGVEYVAPRDDVEQRMADLWVAVLAAPDVGVHDSFFDLGGNSLLGIDLLTRVNRAFATDLQWSDLFGSPTVAGVTELVRSPGHLVRR